MQNALIVVLATRRMIMSQSLKVFASLGHVKVVEQIDQELVKSYLELQKLRQQVRIAQCGRAILFPAQPDWPTRN
jgi:hypothetical protein